jgi:hypothetical protein
VSAHDDSDLLIAVATAVILPLAFRVRMPRSEHKER